jgi:hypothetical protein
MNHFRSFQTAIICLGAVALIVCGTIFAMNLSRPSDSVIKEVIAKQMAGRLKGGSIVSETIIRGQSFPNEAHFSKVPYGTILYPVVVNLTYNTKQKDGTLSENKDLSRTLNFYKDATHHWVNDDQLH